MPRYCIVKRGESFNQLSFLDSDAVTSKFFFHSMIWLIVSNTTLSDQFFGYSISIHCFQFFSNARSNFSHVEVLLKTLWTVPSISFLSYCKGAQPLKFRAVSVSVGFWYRPHVTFFPESTLVFKSNQAKLPLPSSSSVVN